jgi:hypothetical protein
MSEENKAPTLNGVPVTPEQLQEEKEKLPGNQRIVEVTPGENRKIHRMQE